VASLDPHMRSVPSGVRSWLLCCVEAGDYVAGRLDALPQPEVEGGA
jgi:hypothetical protein